MKAFLLKMAAFTLFLLVVVEVVFRTLLPASAEPATIQLEEYGILAMDTSRSNTGRLSIGRFCRPSYRWHINNDGFNSTIDYRSADVRGRPCAVVIGNSYSLGLYGDVDESLAARLDAGLGDVMAVYNLAVSGMPMSQVPLVARFSVARYAPDLIIVQCSARSVAGSLKKEGSNPYNQQYILTAGGIERRPPRRFVPNPYKHLVLKSALVRYLLYNANYDFFGGGLVQDAVQRPSGGEAGAEADSTAALVLDEAFREISLAAPETKVLVVLDADRNAIYDAATKPSPLQESAAIARACRRHGFAFLDLTDAFWQVYRADGRRFDFDDNYHWNPYGVGVVADAVLAEIDALGIPADSYSPRTAPRQEAGGYQSSTK